MRFFRRRGPPKKQPSQDGSNQLSTSYSSQQATPVNDVNGSPEPQSSAIGDQGRKSPPPVPAYVPKFASSSNSYVQGIPARPSAPYITDEELASSGVGTVPLPAAIARPSVVTSESESDSDLSMQTKSMIASKEAPRKDIGLRPSGRSKQPESRKVSSSSSSSSSNNRARQTTASRVPMKAVSPTRRQFESSSESSSSENLRVIEFRKKGSFLQSKMISSKPLKMPSATPDLATIPTSSVASSGFFPKAEVHPVISKQLELKTTVNPRQMNVPIVTVKLPPSESSSSGSDAVTASKPNFLKPKQSSAMLSMKEVSPSKKQVPSMSHTLVPSNETHSTISKKASTADKDIFLNPRSSGGRPQGPQFIKSQQTTHQQLEKSINRERTSPRDDENMIKTISSEIETRLRPRIKLEVERELLEDMRRDFDSRLRLQMQERQHIIDLLEQEIQTLKHSRITERAAITEQLIKETKSIKELFDWEIHKIKSDLSRERDEKTLWKRKIDEIESNYLQKIVESKKEIRLQQEQNEKNETLVDSLNNGLEKLKMSVVHLMDVNAISRQCLEKMRNKEKDSIRLLQMASENQKKLQQRLQQSISLEEASHKIYKAHLKARALQILLKLKTPEIKVKKFAFDLMYQHACNNDLDLLSKEDTRLASTNLLFPRFENQEDDKQLQKHQLDLQLVAENERLQNEITRLRISPDRLKKKNPTLDTSIPSYLSSGGPPLNLEDKYKLLSTTVKNIINPLIKNELLRSFQALRYKVPFQLRRDSTDSKKQRHVIISNAKSLFQALQLVFRANEIRSKLTAFQKICTKVLETTKQKEQSIITEPYPNLQDKWKPYIRNSRTSGFRLNNSTPWDVPYYQHKPPAPRHNQYSPNFVVINSMKQNQLPPAAPQFNGIPLDFLRNQFSVGVGLGSPMTQTPGHLLKIPKDYKNVPLGILGTGGVGFGTDNLPNDNNFEDKGATRRLKGKINQRLHGFRKERTKKNKEVDRSDDTFSNGSRSPSGLLLASSSSSVRTEKESTDEGAQQRRLPEFDQSRKSEDKKRNALTICAPSALSPIDEEILQAKSEEKLIRKQLIKHEVLLKHMELEAVNEIIPIQPPQKIHIKKPEAKIPLRRQEIHKSIPQQLRETKQKDAIEAKLPTDLNSNVPIQKVSKDFKDHKIQMRKIEETLAKDRSDDENVQTNRTNGYKSQAVPDQEPLNREETLKPNIVSDDIALTIDAAQPSSFVFQTESLASDTVPIHQRELGVLKSRQLEIRKADSENLSSSSSSSGGRELVNLTPAPLLSNKISSVVRLEKVEINPKIQSVNMNLQEAEVMSDREAIDLHLPTLVEKELDTSTKGPVSIKLNKLPLIDSDAASPDAASRLPLKTLTTETESSATSLREHCSENDEGLTIRRLNSTKSVHSKDYLKVTTLERKQFTRKSVFMQNYSETISVPQRFSHSKTPPNVAAIESSPPHI